MAPGILCKQCKQKITSKGGSVECSRCKTWYHSGCSGLTNRDFINLCAIHKRDGAHDWLCTVCLQIDNTNVRGCGSINDDKQISDLLNKQSHNISDIVDMMSLLYKVILEQKNSLNQLIADVQKAKDHDTQRIEILETELNLLKSKFESSPDTADMHKMSDEVLTEFHERSERAKNLIMYNIPENDNNDKRIRIEHDKSHVTETLDKLGVQTNQLRVIRIGSRSQRPRPVKVFLHDERLAKKCLSNSKNLKGTNIRVVLDLTPFQRKQLKHTQSELKNRREKGEKDLRIRFIKGVPKITKQRNTHKGAISEN